MPANPLSPFLLETYNLSTSSLGCNAPCIVISFLVLWSICLSSSLVHLRKGPEYLTSVTAQVFIPLTRFLLESFVSSSFLVLLRYSFWILSFISTCLMVSASIIIIIIIYSFRVFHISVNWWFFTGVWVTASLLKSPGLVSGFWPFLVMLSFG